MGVARPAVLTEFHPMLLDRRSLLCSTLAIPALLTPITALAAEIRSMPVRQDGIVGELHSAEGGGRKTTVIMLNGSDGGVPSARDARDLAAAGYTVLSLAYFKDWQGAPEGVPSSLNDIPLEYFFRAIEWLKLQPQVDGTRIVLMGQSRGGELALLLASMRPDIAGVIAFSPSGRVWSGVPPFGAPAAPLRPAWTLNGRALPYQTSTADPAAPMRSWFERAKPVEAARIPVERIRGPVLLVSSRADTIWPATTYADEIAATLARHGVAARVRNLQFADASHLLMGTGPGITKLKIPGADFTFDFGGTAEANTIAREQAWAASKQLLASL